MYIINVQWKFSRRVVFRIIHVGDSLSYQGAVRLVDLDFLGMCIYTYASLFIVHTTSEASRFFFITQGPFQLNGFVTHPSLFLSIILGSGKCFVHSVPCIPPWDKPAKSSPLKNEWISVAEKKKLSLASTFGGRILLLSWEKNDRTLKKPEYLITSLSRPGPWKKKFEPPKYSSSQKV